MTNAKDAVAASVPAVLMRFTIQTAVQTSCLTVRWQNMQLGEHLTEPGWNCHHDHFKDSNPNIEWEATLDQAEKIGLGTRQYELKRIK